MAGELTHVNSPTWGPPPPCKQALKSGSYRSSSWFFFLGGGGRDVNVTNNLSVGSFARGMK